MQEFELNIDEKLFKLIWRSLEAREENLVSDIQQAGEGSDEAALLGNDLVYLRLAQKELREEANDAGFPESAFSTDDGFLDLSNL